MNKLTTYFLIFLLAIAPVGTVSFGVGLVSKADAHYKNVADQAGIYAGEQGFDINVRGNTN